MRGSRLGWLVLAAVVVIALAWYASAQRSPSKGTAGLAVLPALATELNAATAVTVHKGGKNAAVTMHETGGRWTVAERGDYPADPVKLRALLTALRDAHIVEEKTSDPKLFSVLGVEDPIDPAAPGVEVAVVTPTTRAGLIIGKPVGDGNYGRRTGENRSFSIAPAISVETEPQFWIDARVLDVPAALVQSIEYKPAAGPAYRLHRLNPADNTFSLDGAPSGRKPLEAHALAPAQSLLTGLMAEDVATASTADRVGESQVVITLTDGNVLTLTGSVRAEQHWVAVQATKDGVAPGAARDHVYRIASYRYDAIFKPLEQLLEPLSQPAPRPAKSTVRPGAAPLAPAAPKKSPPGAAAP